MRRYSFGIAVVIVIVTLGGTGALAAQPAGRPWFEIGVGPAAAPNDLIDGHMSRLGLQGRVSAGIHTVFGYGVRVHALGALFPSNTDHIHEPGLGHPPPAALLLWGVGASAIIGSHPGAGRGGLHLAGGGGYWTTGHELVESGSGWGWHAGAGWTVPVASGTAVIELSLHRAPGVGDPRETLWLLPLTLGWRF